MALRVKNKDDDFFDKETFFVSIYAGSINPRKVSKQLYLKIAEDLKKGVYEGFGGTLLDFEFGTPDLKLITELRQNIYIFSGAKAWWQIKEMSDILTEGGRIMPFNEFRKKADSIFELYNKTHLQVEYDTALGQAQNARKWNDVQASKNEFPYLRRVAVIDANTSPECRILNGITAKVDDPFWKTRSPLSHFECRCLFQKLDEYEVVKLSPPDKIKEAIKSTENLQPMFKSNPGITGEVFNGHHPYFAVPKQYEEFAKMNFGLPIPKKD